MTESRTARRRGMLRSLVAALVMSGLLASGLAAVLLGAAAESAAAASTSQGSVPADVTAYVSSGGLVARLNNVYGPNASGTKGISFDATTKTGPISRVYEWTARRVANQVTDHPVQLTNNWVVPITIGDKSVGLATIWINPQTVQPELAAFAPDAKLATALTAIPVTSALVRDTATGAWLALDGSTVTPLVAGKSGLTTPAPVASLTLSAGAAAPITAAAEPNTGLALAIGLVGLVVVVIVVALLVPRGRRARTARRAIAHDAASVAAATPAAEPEPEPEPGPESEAGGTPERVAKKSPIKQPPVKRPTSGPVTKAPADKTPATQAPAAKPPVPAATTPLKAATPKPSVPRPAGRTPTNSSASKPASSKPGATKPSAAKPPVSKPPAPKQPPRPRTPRPKPPSPESGSPANS